MKSKKFKFLKTIDNITTFALAGVILFVLLLIIEMIRRNIKVDFFSISGVILGFITIAYTALYLNYSCGIDLAKLYTDYYNCSVNGFISYNELISKTEEKFKLLNNTKWKLRNRSNGFNVYDEVIDENESNRNAYYIRENSIFQYCNNKNCKPEVIYKHEGGIVVVDAEIYLIDPLTYAKFMYYKKKLKVIRIAEGK